MLGPDACGRPPPAFGSVFLPRFFLRWGRKNRAPGGRQVICLVDITCRKLQVCFLKPGVVEYCVENLLLLCINPSTLYGFDLANRAARSWSLTHTQGSLWCPAPLGVQCKLAGATPQSRLRRASSPFRGAFGRARRTRQKARRGWSLRALVCVLYFYNM